MMNIKKITASVILFSVLLNSYAFAENLEPVNGSEPEYYSIEEANTETQFRKPPVTEVYALTSELSLNSIIQSTQTLVLSLLKWTLHSEARPLPTESYIRKLHFGRWINDPTDDRCMNTRAVVLVRNSEGDVTYRNDHECVVDTGRWTDPYSGHELMTAREIQIDHMVPLKQAYVSGAWRWDYKTRCLFANYLGYQNHLVPSSVRENTSKGDRAPDRYVPSNESYLCTYVKDWLAIKLIWRLTMTSEEANAIHAIIESKNCDMSTFEVTEQELQGQRKYINDNIEYCMYNKN